MASIFRTLSIEASALNYQQESIILQQYFHPTDKYTFWSCLKNNLPSFGGVSFYNDVMVAILPLSVTGQGWASEDSLMILLIEEVWEGKKKKQKKTYSPELDTAHGWLHRGLLYIMTCIA